MAKGSDNKTAGEDGGGGGAILVFFLIVLVIIVLGALAYLIYKDMLSK